MTTEQFLRKHPEFRGDGELAVSQFSLNAVAYTSDEGSAVEFIDLQEGEVTDPLEWLIADESAVTIVEVDEQEPEQEPEPDDEWGFLGDISI